MDSAAKIVSCMQLAAKSCDVAVPSAQQASDIIGISLRPAIQKLFATDDEGLTDRLVAAYKKAYLQQDVKPCPMFTGAIAMLQALKDDKRQLAVATGKARRGLNRVWQHTGTGDFFTTSRTADEAESKPSSDMLLQILQETGVDVTDALMVGDTTYDMQMAQAIGMDRIGVSYGVHAQVHLENHAPLAVVHSVGELQSMLLPHY